MNTARELMERLQVDGAARFADTELAHGHARVTRKVRRDRAVRASVVTVGSVAVAGAAAIGIANYGPTTATPGVTPTEPSGVPSASPSATPELITLSVVQEDRRENIARALAMAYGTTEEDAFSALTGALPPEAGGNPEGWVLAGEYSFEADATLDEAAAQMIGTMTAHLESEGVPREQWLDAVILASIVQQEAPALADQGYIARVLVNRLGEGMPLQVESPLAFYLHADEKIITDDGWAVDTPYNTYMYEGLPPGAIGAFRVEALNAAAHPSAGDWMFFLRTPDGMILLFDTFDEYAVAVDEYFPGTGASG